MLLSALRENFRVANPAVPGFQNLEKNFRGLLVVVNGKTVDSKWAPKLIQLPKKTIIITNLVELKARFHPHALRAFIIVLK